MAARLTAISLLPQRKRRRILVAARNGHHRAPVQYSAYQKEALRTVENLARICEYEETHTRHVTRLALRLFDELQRLHRLGHTERFYLECAGMLHDIGWIEGWKNHHKHSLDIILRTTILPFDSRERLIIGSIARYHTKALPSLDHDHLAALEPTDRRVALTLSSMLRLADSLDRTHRCVIDDVRCKITPNKIRVRYQAGRKCARDVKAAEKGKDLLQMMFERPVMIERKKA